MNTRLMHRIREAASREGIYWSAKAVLEMGEMSRFISTKVVSQNLTTMAKSKPLPWRGRQG